MKRLALLLLAMTMMFVLAGAEELFVEEGFETAASFDDEFFAEEAFFGDEFEADQPELEGEAEDRSVFFFEEEDDKRGAAEDLVGWQKWEIKNLTATEGKKGKVTLTWTLEKGGDVPPTLPESSAQPTKKEMKAQKGVKLYIYQVDAKTGIPTQAKKAVSMTKKNVSVKVKTAGTYVWYARLEKVNKDGTELLGRKSNVTTPLIIKSLTKKAVTKVKASYKNASEQPSKQPSDQPVVTVSADVYAKDADTSYTIKVAQKKGASDTATYKPADKEKVKNDLQAYGCIHIDLFDNEEVKWNKGNAPKLEANGKKITVSVKADSEGKFKKGSVTPKKITKKTQPVITSAVQVDATHVYVTWYDQADRSGVSPAASYKIAAGKAAKAVTVPKANLKENPDGSYSYNFEVKANTKAKAKNIKITVKPDVAKSKKSKAFKVALQPVGKGAILNLGYKVDKDGILLTWNTTVEAVYEVFATDSVHSAEIFTTGEMLKAQSDQPSSGPEATIYSARITNRELARLKEGYRWSFTVKAINDMNVIARQVVYMGKDEVSSEQLSVQPIETNDDVKTDYDAGDKIDFASLFDSDYELDIVIYKAGTTEKVEPAADGTLPAGTYDVVATAKANKSLTAKVTITIKDAGGSDEPVDPDKPEPEVGGWKVAAHTHAENAALSDNDMTLTYTNLVLPFEKKEDTNRWRDGAWVAAKIYNNDEFDPEKTEVKWDGGYPYYSNNPLSEIVENAGDHYFLVWLHLDSQKIARALDQGKETIFSTVTITEDLGNKTWKTWTIDVVVDLKDIEITAEDSKNAIKVVNYKIEKDWAVLNVTTGTKYETVEAAFADAKDGDMVKLLRDATTKEWIKIGNSNPDEPDNRKIEFDLAGQKLTLGAPFQLSTGGDLTVTNGTITSNMKIFNMTEWDTGKLTLGAGFKAVTTNTDEFNPIIDAFGSGEIIIDGADLTAENGRVITSACENTITIKSGNFVGDICSQSGEAGTSSINIQGGTIEGNISMTAGHIITISAPEGNEILITGSLSSTQDGIINITRYEGNTTTYGGISITGEILWDGDDETGYPDPERPQSITINCGHFYGPSYYSPETETSPEKLAPPHSWFMARGYAPIFADENDKTKGYYVTGSSPH